MKINPQINMFGWYWNVLAVSSEIACVYVVCTFTLWMTLCLYMSMFVNTDAYKREKHNALASCREKVSFLWVGNGHVWYSKVMTVLCRSLQTWNLYTNILYPLRHFFSGKKKNKQTIVIPCTELKFILRLPVECLSMHAQGPTKRKILK